MAKDVTAEGHKPYENMWVLKTDQMIPNLTWWWWWWIFFIKDPERPGRTKQLMILGATKYTDNIKVMDRRWSVSKLPTWEDGVLKFNGMVAAWWFDGREMHDPLMLEEADFEVRHRGDEGELKPIMEGTDYRFFGGPSKYTVNVKDKDNDFHFEMTPWNEYLQRHRFNESQYTKKYSYNIMKIFGMKLSGTIKGVPIEGSAYLQRVTVNAPAPPWYWGLVHSQDGSYVDYFMPYIGPQIFRWKESADSWWDACDIRLHKSIHFYHAPSGKEYKFGTGHTRIKHRVVDGLPVFEITGRDKEKEFFMRLKAYTRAFWRFEQPRRMGMRSILYYNEYPAEVDDFRFRLLDGSLTVGKKDLGHTASNFEHSWGKLI